MAAPRRPASPPPSASERRAPAHRSESPTEIHRTRRHRNRIHKRTRLRVERLHRARRNINRRDILPRTRPDLLEQPTDIHRRPIRRHATTERTTTADVPRVTPTHNPSAPPMPHPSTTKFDSIQAAASPSAVPGGRSRVNVPPTNTLPCAAAMPHTVPLVCHVGNESAVKCSDGANAAAGKTTHNDKTNARAVPNAASLRMTCPQPKKIKFRQHLRWITSRRPSRRPRAAHRSPPCTDHLSPDEQSPWQRVTDICNPSGPVHTIGRFTHPNGLQHVQDVMGRAVDCACEYPAAARRHAAGAARATRGPAAGRRLSRTAPAPRPTARHVGRVRVTAPWRRSLNGRCGLSRSLSRRALSRRRADTRQTVLLPRVGSESGRPRNGPALVRRLPEDRSSRPVTATVATVQAVTRTVAKLPDQWPERMYRPAGAVTAPPTARPAATAAALKLHRGLRGRWLLRGLRGRKGAGQGSAGQPVMFSHLRARQRSRIDGGLVDDFRRRSC